MPDRVKAYLLHRAKPRQLVAYKTADQEARVTELADIQIICKYCGSDKTVRYGFQSGAQQYWCKNCQRKFTANDALPQMRFHPEQIATALTNFYEGMSLDSIGRNLQDEAGISPSGTTIYNWVVKFTEKASATLSGIRGDVGRIWVVDETVLHAAGREAWFWDVIAEETRFLVASHLTYMRSTNAAVWLFNQAIQRVERIPLQIKTDGLASYPDAIEKVFGGTAKHIPSKGFEKRPNTNLIERFHSTLKQRTKVMRGLQNLQTARLLLDGWLINYNFFRPHETLNGRTPALAAGMTYPYHNWRDVVMDGHIPTQRKTLIAVTNF